MSDRNHSGPAAEVTGPWPDGLRPDWPSSEPDAAHAIIPPVPVFPALCPDTARGRRTRHVSPGTCSHPSASPGRVGGFACALRTSRRSRHSAPLARHSLGYRHPSCGSVGGRCDVHACGPSPHDLQLPGNAAPPRPPGLARRLGTHRVFHVSGGIASHPPRLGRLSLQTR